ncbi:3-hydroxyisobutyryl-CoA hydrolase, partial [Lecanoromycetidae sp. Uapishka_2]
MPLKAKILNPAISWQSTRVLRSHRTILRSDDPDDVLFNSIYGVRTIELNRPKKLNSLNASMARGAGPKAFCAGGDVAALAQQNTNGPEGQAASQAYFGLEYQLDHLIATYPKPYIAYMDGITMGGGVGLSVHAPIRIATERTLFAMPETTIGFFPDVGGSFFLSRLEGYIGTYLALTSERLKGVNAFYAGVATHYIDSSTLSSLTARLAELEFKDYEDMHTRLATIAATIAEYDTGLPHDEPMLLAGELRKAIDRCFKYSSVEEIIDALQVERMRADEEDEDGNVIVDWSEFRNWATATLKTLSERSPTSLKVALKQIREGRRWTIAEAFRREYEMAGHFMSHPDFNSGVSARLIHKPATTPVWDPPTLEGVTKEAVNAMFRMQEGNRELELLGARGQRAYTEYPFKMGLPREEEVEDVVRQGGVTRKQVLKKFEKSSGARTGVREKVDEVVSRKCGVDAEGKLVWIEEQ